MDFTYRQQHAILKLVPHLSEVEPGVFTHDVTARTFDLLQARATKSDIGIISDIVKFIELNAKERAYLRVQGFCEDAFLDI